MVYKNRPWVLASLGAALLSLLPGACSRPRQTYQVLEIHDSSHLGAKRVSAKISVPIGLSRIGLESVLQLAAYEVQQSERAKAVIIHAYRSAGEASGPYTVGTATRAPNGRWENAAANGPMQTVFAIDESYFQQVQAEEQAESENMELAPLHVISFEQYLIIATFLQAIACGAFASHVAGVKGHGRENWFACGFLFSIIGLIAAAGLPMAERHDPTKPCPGCGERVKVAARVCRYCREQLEVPENW